MLASKQEFIKSTEGPIPSIKIMILTLFFPHDGSAVYPWKCSFSNHRVKKKKVIFHCQKASCDLSHGNEHRRWFGYNTNQPEET